jgi:hypothetical protein
MIKIICDKPEEAYTLDPARYDNGTELRIRQTGQKFKRTTIPRDITSVQDSQERIWLQPLWAQQYPEENGYLITRL